MRKHELVLTLLFGLIFLGFISLFAVLILTDNVTEWIPTEDSNCYLMVHHDNRLVGEDVVTRERFCKEG